MSVTQAVAIEEAVQFTLAVLSRVCGAHTEHQVALVREGALDPSGDDPQSWRSEDTSMRRASTALRLTRDLELGAAGACPPVPPSPARALADPARLHLARGCP